MTNRRISFVLAVAGVAACASLIGYGQAYASEPDSYQTALEAAQTLRNEALAQVCGWSITDPAITEAQKLHEQGKDQAATAAAAHAEDLAELSLKQCAEQKTAWKRAVIR